MNDEYGLCLRLTLRDIDDYPDLYERDLPRMVEQAEKPSGEQDGRTSSAARRLQMRNERDGQKQSYEYFEQDLESLQARVIESAPAPSPPDMLAFFEEEWAQQRMNCGATPAEVADKRLYRADSSESRIESLARSFRLLSFREIMLYIRLQNDSAQIPRLQIPLKGLNTEQAKALFLEIDIDIVQHVCHGYPESTNRARRHLSRKAW